MSIAVDVELFEADVWAELHAAETFPPSPANPSLRNMTRLGMRVLYNRPLYRIDVSNAAGE